MCPLRKQLDKFGVHIMADLPKVRCLELPPFTHCGVDMFGTYTIRERRSDLRRYCALFTCFANRAVHIEITNDWDTESFIQALRRFVTRRGHVRSIRSDNGTNFASTVNELRKAQHEMNHEQVKCYLQKNGGNSITWENNPCTASHMRGVWEHQIQTARTILDDLLKTNSCSLNDKNSGHCLQRQKESLTPDHLQYRHSRMITARFHFHLVTYSHRKPWLIKISFAVDGFGFLR